MKKYMVCAVLVASISFCSSGVPKMETKGFTISDTLKISTFSTKVMQYGAEKSLYLSDLKLKVDGSMLKGSVKVKKVVPNRENFWFFMYIVGEKHMTYVHFTPKIRQTFVTPKGSMGDVGLSMGGYGLEGDILMFDMPTSVYGIYDSKNARGHVFVFCMSEDKDNQVKDGSLVAISNVLETDI